MKHLSKSQQLIYDMEKYAGGSVSVICGSMLLRGEKDTAALQMAVNELYRRNPALRTRIANTDTGPMQTVAEYSPQDIPILRFSNKTELDTYANSYAQKAQELHRHLCEINVVLLPGKYGILVKLHHIIGDAWTLALIGSQYNAILAGETPPAYPYFDHLKNENAYLDSERCAKDQAYFLEQFRKCEDVTYLSEKQSTLFTARRKTFVLDEQKTRQLTNYARAHDSSAFVLFMTALAVYISRVKQNTEKFYIGTAVLNRSGVREKNTMGMFVNTVPLLIELENEQPFSHALAAVKSAAFAVFRHQRFHYGDILSAVRREYHFGEKLYDVMLSYQNATIVGGTEGMESTWYHSGTQTESLQIHIDDRDREGVFRIHFDYQTEKFSEKEIESMYGHLLTLLFDAIGSEDKKLFELELLSPEEKRQLLDTFNDTAADYPKDKCVHTLFEEQAAKTPDKTAVIACDRTLTYRKLNEQANRIAHSLIERGVQPGDIVAFALPRRSFLIAAIFGILKAGAAYLPIDPDYPQDRIDFMLEDSKAAYFITEANVQELFRSETVTDPSISLASNSLCYCIYTSGSTGKPKGTLLRHSGIINLVTNLNIYHDFSNCDRIGFMTTITFDVATQEIFTALLNGFTGVLVTERKETSTTEIIDSIQNNKIDVLYATPTYFDALTDSAEKAGRILSFVKVICLAGEKFYLNRNVLSIKSQYPVIFENQYGPAETHVISATMAEDYSDITIGQPIANTQIYIVDKYMHPVPIGVTGELCIAGDGVGAGYLNRPELTAEKFIANPFGTGKLYKTGDLAYWREDGNIGYVGRNDFQVKIRGLRIELGEIESVLQKAEGISQAAVVVRKNEAGRQLICAFYTGQAADSKILRTAIGQKLPKYMVPHVFTHVDSLPLTTSGKVNRNALPAIDLSHIAAETEYAAPVTEREIAVAHAVQTVLQIEKTGMRDNFFDLGGDSLKAIELSAVLEQAHYRAPVKTIFSADTLRELAEQLTSAEVGQKTELPTGPIPATDAQIRIYTAQAVAGGTAYNVPYAFRVRQLDPVKLQAAVSELVARHESLRTRFENRDGQLLQIVEDFANCTTEALDSEDISAFVRPFDLETAPLLRIGYYQNTVMIDLHHIITDGGSMPVFLRELNELYMGRSLNEKAAPYREFALQNQDHTQSEQYWLSVYADALPVLEMNTDYPRQSKQSFSGAALYQELPGSLHTQICEECRSVGVTPYTFYIGAFYILLSKFSGNEDIPVGIPASGRSGAFLNSIGMFVNTLVLRGRPEGGKTIAAFLREIREMTVQALDNQDYPYGDFVRKLNIHTENRNPLFDVMFAYQSEEMTEVVFGDEPAELLPVPITASKYDFTFNVMPRQDDVVFMVEYCTDLYKEQTVKRLSEAYQQILTQMLDGERKIWDISAVTESERQKLLYDFNDTAEDYPRDKCVHMLFEEQAAKTPDKTAVIAFDRTLTYRELNEQANRIAHGLIGQGVRPGDIVAFALPRKSYLIAAMFGILKAGAAYLPIDLDYPENRINYLIRESNARLCITQEEIALLLENSNGNDPGIRIKADDRFCALHTSGSTGAPKLSLLKHGGLCNFMWANRRFWTNTDTVVSATIVTFDAFTMDSVLSIAQGYQLVLASEADIYNQPNLEQLFRHSAHNMFFSTPTKIESYLDNSPTKDFLQRVQSLVIGGEIFGNGLLDKLKNYSPNCRIFNIYGPTETTICATVDEVEQGQTITIGVPIANTQIYILDKYMTPVPIGVTGELCIAGDGVGAGYLNRPELTAEKFVDNPFGAGKLYKTGDLAYWREDGNIVYVGRNDFQVKIRGLRIEMGEIENALQAVEGISQAVAVVRKNEAGRQLICAFYTGQAADSKTLRIAIGQRLPKYMLPHSFTHLEAMPLTASGKVDRKALPEVDLSSLASPAEYIPPSGELEKRLAALMEQVLEDAPVGRDDDFFDLGGDSLKAIEFVSMAHNDGIYFSLQSIFDHPTVKSLREHIELGDQQSISCAEEDFAAINGLLAKNCMGAAAAPSQKEVGNLLLTGATGFLGIHILAEFLEHDSGTVYCLVRGDDQDACKKRFAHLLDFYFDGKYADLLGRRIQVICGDLQKDSLGLTKQEYHDLQKSVDTVLNAAASVKHYGSYQYFYEANVESTRRLIDFCMPAGIRLIHISTLSVSGNSFGDQFDGYISETEKHFYEKNLYIGQPLENVYARSKFEAEKAVLEAMASGLRANIMRMGNLTNRRRDGKFQINHETNAFAQRIKGVLELGMVPDYLLSENMYAEFTPVDEAACAVMTIVRHFSTEQTVFHINSTKVVYLDRLMEYFAELGCPVRAATGAEFTQALRRTAKQTGMEHIFEIFINDLDEQDHLNYDSGIRIENHFTEEYLKRLGFAWAEIGIEYLHQYAAYFEKIGYWKNIPWAGQTVTGE